MALFLLTLRNILHIFVGKYTAEEVVQDLYLLAIRGHSTTTTVYQVSYPLSRFHFAFNVCVAGLQCMYIYAPGGFVGTHEVKQG